MFENTHNLTKHRNMHVYRLIYLGNNIHTYTDTHTHTQTHTHALVEIVFSSFTSGFEHLISWEIMNYKLRNMLFGLIRKSSCLNRDNRKSLARLCNKAA